MSDTLQALEESLEAEIERAFWSFVERKSRKRMPQSERDAFKWAVRELFSSIVISNDIHLSSGGKDPDEKRYSKRDVEFLVAVSLAAERAKRVRKEGVDAA